MVQGTYVLPALLTRFRRQYPRARLHVTTHAPEALGETVLRGHVDFAVSSETAPLLPALRAEPLWVEPMVLAAPADHPLAARARLTLADLAEESFVASRAGTLGDRALDAALAAAGLPARRIVLEVGPQEVVKQAVLEGAGLAVLFRCVAAAELAAGRLVALPLTDVSMSERFCLISRRGQRFSPLAQNLVDFIRAAARQRADAPSG